jgi:hypothetical protein
MQKFVAIETIQLRGFQILLQLSKRSMNAAFSKFSLFFHVLDLFRTTMKYSQITNLIDQVVKHFPYSESIASFALQLRRIEKHEQSEIACEG